MFCDVKLCLCLQGAEAAAPWSRHVRPALVGRLPPGRRRRPRRHLQADEQDDRPSQDQRGRKSSQKEVQDVRPGRKESQEGGAQNVEELRG